MAVRSGPASRASAPESGTVIVQSVERTTVSRPGLPSDCQSSSSVVGTAVPVPVGSGSLDGSAAGGSEVASEVASEAGVVESVPVAEVPSSSEQPPTSTRASVRAAAAAYR